MPNQSLIISYIVIGFAFVSAAAAPAIAQEPIRVDTNEVLVPVTVEDSERIKAFRKDPKDTGDVFRSLMAGDAKRAEDYLEGFVIPDLTATDFRVFEDGERQEIRSVTYERSLFWNFRDNGGFHTEFVGSGTGKWVAREWPPGTIGDYWPPHYLIAYAPHNSPENSCHDIRVEVNRPNALVQARGNYCTGKRIMSDPLNGTIFGQQMEKDLVSSKDNSIEIAVTVSTFFADSGKSCLHIAVEWPWKSFDNNFRAVGILGVLFNKDGSLAARFSDVYELPVKEQGHRGVYKTRSFLDSPVRYETQLALPPGHYEMQIALSDGSKFGRSNLPAIVEDSDGKALAVSDVALARQIQDASAYSSRSVARLPGTWASKLPGNYMPLISNGIEFKATSDTRFHRKQTLYAYFEVFEPVLEARSSPNVNIQIQIVDVKTGEVKSDPGLISAMPYVKPNSQIITVGRGIKINNLPAGAYRLDVRAVDSAGKRTEWHHANFSVE
jgi:hypothetical protein